MRALSPEEIAEASEIGRHSCRATTNLSVRRKFAKCASIVWVKPAPTIASIIGCDIRTAQRILAGRDELPWCVIREFIDEMSKPE